MDEPTLTQSIAQLLAKVPRPVQEYVVSDLSNEVRSLMDKYQLHVDQGGVLQNELLLMLLGQEEPAEFMKELRAAGIGEGTVQSLMVDINEDVFKPLRKKEQEVGVAPAQRVPEPVSQTTPPPPAPTPIPPPPPPPDRGVRTMEADMQAAQAAQAQQYMPGAQTQTYWVPVSITAIPQPYMTTQPPPQAYPQQAPPPPPTPPPAIEERPAPPPPPLREERTWEPPPPPNLPTVESQPNTPIKKEYGADPYREPV